VEPRQQQRTLTRRGKRACGFARRCRTHDRLEATAQLAHLGRFESLLERRLLVVHREELLDPVAVGHSVRGLGDLQLWWPVTEPHDQRRHHFHGRIERATGFGHGAHVEAVDRGHVPDGDGVRRFVPVDPGLADQRARASGQPAMTLMTLRWKPFQDDAHLLGQRGPDRYRPSSRLVSSPHAGQPHHQPDRDRQEGSEDQDLWSTPDPGRCRHRHRRHLIVDTSEPSVSHPVRRPRRCDLGRVS
jgi:hypothetical protein